MTVVKDERLQIRVDPTEKRLLESAAAAAHVSVSAFVVQSAAMRAEEILAERQTIRLSESAVVAFTQALEQPAMVNERLADALRRPRKFRRLDPGVHAAIPGFCRGQRLESWSRPSALGPTNASLEHHRN